jgi:hypothetical protein
MATEEHAGCCAAVWGPDPGVCDGPGGSIARTTVELIGTADRLAGSLVAGAIARALDDAHDGYRARLAREAAAMRAATVQG